MLPEEITSLVTHARAHHQKIVLASGVFDVLHAKHLSFLEDAKQAGDILLVALESDVRVKKMKGEDRPFHAQGLRLQHLRDLQIADAVFLLPENFSQPDVRDAFMSELRPDILAVSSHSLHQKEKQQLAEKYGGKLVVVTQYDPAYSSTQAIAALQKT